MEMTSHHLSVSQRQIAVFCLLSGEGIKQACEYKEARIVGIHLGVCLLQILGRRYYYLTVGRTKALRG